MELGQLVMVQNQRSPGSLTKKSDRTGVVVECPWYDKYTIRMDGSGNVTDRNRKYLRAFTPDHKINPPSPHIWIGQPSSSSSSDDTISLPPPC